MRENLEKHGLASGKPGDILWNFEKFLTSRRGEIVARFAPDVAPDDPLLIEAIEMQLAIACASAHDRQRYRPWPT